MSYLNSHMGKTPLVEKLNTKPKTLEERVRRLEARLENIFPEEMETVWMEWLNLDQRLKKLERQVGNLAPRKK